MAQTIEQTTKVCSSCKIEKPLDRYSRHKGKPNNVRYSCKDCENIKTEKWRKENNTYFIEYYEANKEKILEKQATYYRENLQDIRARHKAYANKNKKQVAAYGANWIKENPEKNRAKRARRRALQNKASVYELPKKYIERLYKQSCVYCGSQNLIEMDHVIPLDKGGNHSIGNIAPACRACNRSKGNKTVMEWRKSQLGNIDGTD